MTRALNEQEKREYISEHAYLLTLLGEYDKAENFILNYFASENFDTSFYYEISEMNVLIEDANKALLFGIMYADLYKDDTYYDDLFKMFTIGDSMYEHLFEEDEELVVEYVFQM